MGEYAWALWLAGPVVATALAALWVWWRGRPARVPRPKKAMAEHRAYLDALRQTAAAHTTEDESSRVAAKARRSPSVARQARSTVSR
ncbi:MAG TPA: hypothetical protein VH373_18400 [Jatrophihabitantaceae bacterium]